MLPSGVVGNLCQTTPFHSVERELSVEFLHAIWYQP